MDQKQPPQKSNNLVPEDVDAIAIVRRRKAIQLFLNNPEEAIQLYPELETDLIIFFARSSNPNLNPVTGLPTTGRENDFERWEEAQQWAHHRLKDA